MHQSMQPIEIKKEIMMLYSNIKNAKGLLVLGSALILSACGSETDKIVDQIDTKH